MRGHNRVQGGTDVDAGKDAKAGFAADYWVKALLAAILILAAGLRLYGVEKECPWYDEITSLRYLQAPGPVQYIQSVQMENPVATPAYYLLQYLWAHLIDDSVVSLRLLSIAMGTVSILVIYLLAARIFNPLAGLLAALFLAVNNLHRLYSLELRGYILIFLLAALSGYAFLLAVETRQKRFWAVSLLCNLLMVWTHIFSVFFFVSQGLVLLGRIRQYRWRFVLWGVLNGLFLISALLWIKLLDPGTVLAAASWIPKPQFLGKGGAGVWGFILSCAGSQRVAVFAPHLGMAEFLLAAVVCLALIAGGGALLRMPGSADLRAGLSPREKLLFLVVWLLAPPVILFVLSYLWVPCFVNRYAFYCLIPFCILAAGGMARLRSRWLCASAILALFTLMSFQTLPLLRVPCRTDWGATASLVQRRAGQGAPVLALDPADIYTLDYYLGPEFQVERSPSVEDMAERAASLAADRPVIFAVLRDNGTRQDRAQFERALAARNVGCKFRCIPSAWPIYLYDIAATSAQGQGRR